MEQCWLSVHTKKKSKQIPRYFYSSQEKSDAEEEEEEVEPWEKLVINPKSARDRARNAEIIRQHNRRGPEEEDDYAGAQVGVNLLNRSEETDSENEVR